MARQDQMTLKKAMSGNYRSHALNSTRRKFNLNLQKVTILENNKKVTYLVSAKEKFNFFKLLYKYKFIIFNIPNLNRRIIILSFIKKKLYNYLLEIYY